MEKLSTPLSSLNYKSLFSKQRTLQTLLIIFLLANSSIGFSQTKFYQKDGKKVNVIGEKTTLTFNSDQLGRPANPEGFAAGAALASLVPSLIDLGFKISTNVIEKNLKKYTNSFTARNAYSEPKQYASGFTVERKIRIKKTTSNSQAFSVKFTPLKVDDNTFVFAVNELSVAYSGAKTKKGYNLNDYAIEIKVTYYDGKEKKEQTSSPISIQLFELSSSEELLSGDGKNASQYKYISDKFPLNPTFVISEISVKIVETNAAKVRAEKIKDFSDNYADDAKDLIKNIVNLYIEDTNKTEEDESEDAEAQTQK